MDVTTFENDLIKVETELERLGRSICSEENGGESWNAINRAVEEVQNAIHSAYKMRNC